MADLHPLSLLTGRWTPHVLLACMGGPQRFTDLTLAVPAVSRQMLTRTLRRLETAGLITRTVHPGFPPRVTYEATAAARELQQPLTELAAWAIRHRHLAGSPRDR